MGDQEPDSVTCFEALDMLHLVVPPFLLCKMGIMILESVSQRLFAN